MEILIISDTHRSLQNLKLVQEEVPHPDMVFHLGDVEGDERRIEAMFDCPCRIVAGNNDIFTDLPRELIVRIPKHRIFMTHGQRYAPFRTTEFLKADARKHRCDIVMFGHTHIPKIDEDAVSGITALNPGSLTYPRQDNHLPSYLYMTLQEDGKAEYEIRYLFDKKRSF